MLVVALAWAPWLVSASVVLAGVWLTLQVLTVGEAAAIVSRIESREGPRSAGSRFDYVAAADLEAARHLIPQVRGPDAPVPPNEGGRLATAVQAALTIMQRAALAGTVKPAALPAVSCILMGGQLLSVEQLALEGDAWAALDIAAVSAAEGAWLRRIAKPQLFNAGWDKDVDDAPMAIKAAWVALLKEVHAVHEEWAYGLAGRLPMVDPPAESHGQPAEDWVHSLG